MGLCQSKPKFSTLDYPSYCTMDPASHDDQVVCYEAWSRAVRTRAEGFPGHDQNCKSFDVLHKKFQTYMMHQGVTEVLPDDFLICLVSTLVHGKLYRASGFRNYDLRPATWSAVGTALFMSVRVMHEPYEWTGGIQAAWTRCFGQFMRAVLARSTIRTRISPTTAAPIHTFTGRRSLRVVIPATTPR